MLDCYLHGMPICQCPTECDGCQRELDPSVAAHHLQTCKRRSSKLPTAHDNLTRTIRSMLNKAGLQSVIDTMKGDIHIPGIRDRGSEQYEGLMADVTLVHPYIGSSADLTKWGEVNLDALHVAASEKIRKHRAAYAMTTPPRAFIPLAISTDGIGFTGRRHTVHSEKRHKHTQNTSPKRTSTAGTQTRQRQPKREAAQTSSLRVKQSSNKQQEHAGGIKSLRRDTRRQPTDHSVAESAVAARDGGDAAAMPKDRRDPTDAGEEAGELGPAASTPVVSSSPEAPDVTVRDGDGTLHPDTLRFIWYLADIIDQRSMPLEDAAFGHCGTSCLMTALLLRSWLANAPPPISASLCS
ncbi:hypothetical protein GUITHDRAFT_103424 [Guillardia theta CCMP2712]|uniref:Uncharacterized protein n=1 Tax=Guillardia theta (strain CCMP2712) TaxID=905079 RepID=L1JRP3_GUITC|nr:hypothetical protein GUITHDRAFT_103424 [Guillardia theta CCMP2712]EKX50835.1 hypothetical protein GUITHDRAFT_103424 [Guillardia theta CCMP2712]|eukprot:XP_005837815.1 hypothetical protein GUITHDRAFT_103424 [Guillardia theta CCMP2712]